MKKGYKKKAAKKAYGKSPKGMSKQSKLADGKSYPKGRGAPGSPMHKFSNKSK